MRRIALAALALCLLPMGPLLAADGAQEKDDICAIWDSKSEDELREEFKGHPNPEEAIRQFKGPAREQACRFTYWRAFKAKPARDVLDAEGFKAYQRALRQADCDTALALLSNAFPAAHPRAPDILNDRDHFARWEQVIVPQQYLELSLCGTNREIQESQTEIEHQGLVVGRYQDGWDFSLRGRDQPVPLVLRNHGIESLIHDRDYPPALLALVKLSHEGKVVRFIPEYQYYLLQRFLLLGGERDQVADMLTAAEARLLPSQMDDLKRQAQAGEYTGPRPTTQ